MKFKVLVAAFFLAAFPVFAQKTSQWELAQSTLTYHVTSPVHQVDGVSHAAKGKGVCQGGQCNFLAAAPVKSFNTGDTNRDLHMLEATRGAQNPMVVVRAQFPEAELQQSTIYADLEIQFAGQTAHYSHVAFQRQSQGDEMRITGTVPSTCSDFKFERPSFLGMSISNDIPVHVDATWKQM
ncbi:MAG TPA: YceI family protein [Terracidiphilus sp.]|nr:YceI family protein [Terracidiphilus sp.]